MIGGPGVTVEVDETCVFKAKYHRGRRFRRHTWLFGGVERGSGRGFLRVVKKRDGPTLTRIIMQHVRPGSVVVSDSWRGYNGFSILPQPYRHLTVNHRIQFVNPNTGAHTQTIESMWQKLKFQAKKRYGMNNSRYADYLAEFLWRREFGKPEEILFNLWNHIALFYPLA